MSTLSESEKKYLKEYFDELYSSKTNESLEKSYNKFSPDYDKLNGFIEYYTCGVANLVRKVLDVFEKSNSQEKKFIDIGCGNGEIGRQLSKHGTWNVDGLDLSPKMIELCSELGFYKKLLNVPLTENETPGIAENTYDGAFSSGCFVESHIPLSTLEELRRIVKPGGYIIYTLNDPNFTMNYMEIQGRFMREKKLKLISMESIKYKREVTMNFEYIYGYLVVFEVLP